MHSEENRFFCFFIVLQRIDIEGSFQLNKNMHIIFFSTINYVGLFLFAYYKYISCDKTDELRIY